MITNRTIFVVLACAVAAGCGSGNSQDIPAPRTVPVTGSVRLNGKPVAGVRVTFHPQFDIGPVKFTPNGETDKEGRFAPVTAVAGAEAIETTYRLD